jgi:ubiquinone/menaquinone biosynthesis C-methylase UbiE
MTTFNLTSDLRTHRQAAWLKRLNAALMARGSAGYERMVGERKRALLGNLSGDVLEIGPGTGPNLAYYSAGIHWIGLEPNPYMHAYLQQAAAQRGLHVDLGSGTAEQLPGADNSLDAVVITLDLCSVTDPAGVLQEIRRVLKPGGRFIFVEHVAAPQGSRTRRFQDWLRPVWNVIGDGCHPNRETWVAIEQAGFERVDYEHFHLAVPITGPHIAGVAIKG